jgi:hypothetical protein
MMVSNVFPDLDIIKSKNFFLLLNEIFSFILSIKKNFFLFYLLKNRRLLWHQG